MKDSPNNDLHISIITGLSGSGKTTALNTFEGRGFYCIDNLPSFLLESLISKARENQLNNNRLALVMDIRDPAFKDFTTYLTDLKDKNFLEIIFLEAREETLIRRFSQHRRTHPIASKHSLRESISKERSMLAPIRKKATTVIDTSHLTPYELRRRLHSNFDDRHHDNFKVNLLSFGFKHGLPHESDMIWDVRFLPNPHYESDLQPLTGKDTAVAQYVLDNEITQQFFSNLDPLLKFLIPRYMEEGKAQLTVGIGCTGGRHRSVAVAERLHTFFSRQKIRVTLCHRDIDRDS